MRRPFMPNRFDFFMLFWAAFPFLVLAYGPAAASEFALDSAIWSGLLLFCMVGVLGFPAAALLYFIWRFRGGAPADSEQG